jgi:DNA-binding MarR family transcriptional regulator
MTSAYRPLLDKLGLTYPQYLVMLVLWEDQELAIKEIGARLFLDSGTLTPMIKRMERAKLVRRVRDQDDERFVRVALASAGKALRARALDVPQQLACRVGMSYDEAMSLRRQVSRITEALCAVTKSEDS